GRAVKELRARTHRRFLPEGSRATNARLDPSGDRATERNAEDSGSTIEECTDLAGSLGPRVTRNATNPAARATTRPKAAKIQGSHALLEGRCTTPAVVASALPAVAIHFSSLPRSRALCQRSSGFFWRHCPTTRSSSGGARGCSVEMAGGCEAMMALIRLAWLPPLKGFLPVAIS